MLSLALLLGRGEADRDLIARSVSGRTSQLKQLRLQIEPLAGGELL